VFLQDHNLTSKSRSTQRTYERVENGLPLLSGGVPNLGLDDLAVDLEGAGGELDADGGLGLEAELVLGEAGEEVRLADAGVADEHHLEEVVVVVLRPVPAPRASHCSSPPSREGQTAAEEEAAF
jgi:hypothetical protein